MKWPTIIVICISLSAAAGCDMRSENATAYDGSALEQLYQADKPYRDTALARDAGQ